MVNHTTLLVDPASIDPNPWNPNEMADRVFTAIGESLEEFGVLLPLIVRPHPETEGRFQIIDGEHRWRQATAQGIPEVECKVLSGLDDATAKRLTLILGEGGEHNKHKLALLLQDLSSELDVQTILRGISTTENEFAELLEIAAFDWESLKNEVDPEDPEEPPSGPAVESGEDVLTIRGEPLNKIRAVYQRTFNEPGDHPALLEFIVGLVEASE